MQHILHPIWSGGNPDNCLCALHHVFDLRAGYCFCVHSHPSKIMKRVFGYVLRTPTRNSDPSRGCIRRKRIKWNVVRSCVTIKVYTTVRLHAFHMSLNLLACPARTITLSQGKESLRTQSGTELFQSGDRPRKPNATNKASDHDTIHVWLMSLRCEKGSQRLERMPHVAEACN